MSSLKLIGGLIVATAVVVFGAQNTQAVTLHLLLFKVPSAPLVLVLFAAVLLGTMLGGIVAAPGRFRRMRQRHELEQQVAAQGRMPVATIDPERSRVS